MNDHDINNVYFILNQTPEQLLVWWNSLDQEDQEYALSIVKQYREELESFVHYENEDIDVSDAKNYLKKFQL